MILLSEEKKTISAESSLHLSGAAKMTKTIFFPFAVFETKTVAITGTSSSKIVIETQKKMSGAANSGNASVCVLVFSVREFSNNRFRDAFGVWNVLQNVFLFVRPLQLMAVCDIDQHNIKIINCETKQLVKTIGSYGSGLQQLTDPYFAAVMPHGKRIAVSD